MKNFIIKFILITGLCHYAVAAQNTAAMVTGLIGNVSSDGNGITLFSELQANSVINLTAKSKITLVLFATGQEFNIEGPGSAEIKSTTIELNGKPLSGKTLLASTEGLTLAPKNFDQAATIMRGETIDSEHQVKIIYPLGGKIMERQPVFKWVAPHADFEYRLQIFNQQGDSLFVTQTRQTELKLPASVNLPVGQELTWDIEASKGDQTLSNTADFMLASPALQERVNKLAPAKNASASSIALYSRILENLGLRHEAEKYKTLLKK